MSTSYLSAFRGSFVGILRWPMFDRLWQTIRTDPTGWYIYTVGETFPEETLSARDFIQFIDNLDRMLRDQHREDYCGVVYADNLSSPSMIKVFNPNNLGVSCGYSENPPLPGWVLSKLKPIDLMIAFPRTKNSQHWWRRLVR